MTEKGVPLISDNARGPLSGYLRNAIWWYTQPRNGGDTIPKSTVEHWLKTVEGMEAEISTLRKSLEECVPYMKHTEGCTAIPRPFTTWKHGHDGVGYDPQTTMKTGPCTCGLSALLSQHQPTGT